MCGSGREALPDVREGSAGPPRCPGLVGSPFQMFVSGHRPFRMSGSGRQASLMSGSGRQALPDC